MTKKKKTAHSSLLEKKRQLAAKPRNTPFSLRFNDEDIKRWRTAVRSLNKRSKHWLSVTDCIEQVLNQWADKVLS